MCIGDDINVLLLCKYVKHIYRERMRTTAKKKKKTYPTSLYEIRIENAKLPVERLFTRYF